MWLTESIKTEMLVILIQHFRILYGLCIISNSKIFSEQAKKVGEGVEVELHSSLT
jgi:hypothetical protein